MNTLKHNIAAMHETKQVPSFVQVLFTLEQAADRIEALEKALRKIEINVEASVEASMDVLMRTRAITRAALTPEQDK